MGISTKQKFPHLCKKIRSDWQREGSDCEISFVAAWGKRNPRLSDQYRGVGRGDLPLCESLKDTIAKVFPYYGNTIFKGDAEFIKAKVNSVANQGKALLGDT